VRFSIRGNTSGTDLTWQFSVVYDAYQDATNFSTNAWHYVEIRYVQNATTGGGQCWIDGDLVFDHLDHNCNTALTSIYMGCGYASAAPAGGQVIYFDDIKADTSAIGAYSDVGGGGGGTAVPIVIAQDRSRRAG
jgi:hypothetical protein